MTDTGDHNTEFLKLWEELSPNERMWTFQTLITLQTCACVVHRGGHILATNEAFGKYLRTSASRLIGDDLQQYIPEPMLHVLRARSYDENDNPYPLVARPSRTLQLLDIEPHVVRLDGHIMRLIFIRPLAKLPFVRWLAKLGGGIAAST